MDCREARCIIQNERKSWGLLDAFSKPSSRGQVSIFLANLRYHNSAPSSPCPEFTACEWQFRPQERHFQCNHPKCPFHANGKRAWLACLASSITNVRPTVKEAHDEDARGHPQDILQLLFPSCELAAGTLGLFQCPILAWIKERHVRLLARHDGKRWGIPKSNLAGAEYLIYCPCAVARPGCPRNGLIMRDAFLW